MKRPWGDSGIGWIAASLLSVLWFLVLLHVLSFATPEVLVIAFGLVAIALLL